MLTLLRMLSLMQSKPELNGQMGSVEDFDAEKGRCHFKFDRGGKTASVSLDPTHQSSSRWQTLQHSAATRGVGSQ